MFSFFKYLPLIMKFKSIAAAYEAEQGQEKPFWLSRRFIGAVIAVLGALAMTFLGITISPEILDTITANLETLLATGVTLYGLIMGLIGIFNKKSKGGTK